jgi:hypothetical protein
MLLLNVMILAFLGLQKEQIIGTFLNQEGIMVVLMLHTNDIH